MLCRCSLRSGSGKAERCRVQQLAPCRVASDAFGGVSVRQTAVPRALRVERDVRPKVALPKARVADETGRRLAAQQLDQPFAQRQRTPFAAVRAAADHHVADGPRHPPHGP